MSRVSAGDLDRVLQQYVRPQSFPMAVGFAAPGAEAPPKLKRPHRDLGIRVAVCQSFAFARRYGWGLAVGREDLSCPLAHVAFGFSPSLPFYEAGNLCVEMYTRDAEAGARSEAAVPRFPLGGRGLLLVAPLGRAAYEPEVVVFYGNGAQVMRLVAAALYEMVECCRYDAGELDSDFAEVRDAFLDGTLCYVALPYRGVTFPDR